MTTTEELDEIAARSRQLLPAIENLHVNDSAADIYRALYRGIEYVTLAAVQGDVAEFGTGTGRTAKTLAKAMAEYGNNYIFSEGAHGIGRRKLYLFDSFQGLPTTTSTIDKKSPHIVSNVWAPGVAKSAWPDLVKEMCMRHLEPERVDIREGWYRDTMRTLKPGVKFALVHIDCDLYESTMDVLGRLFAIDAFAEGCAIYFDDWYCNRGSPAFGEQRAWAECVAKYRPQFTDWGAYATVGHRFIIHRGSSGLFSLLRRWHRG